MLKENIIGITESNYQKVDKSVSHYKLRVETDKQARQGCSHTATMCLTPVTCGGL